MVYCFNRGYRLASLTGVVWVLAADNALFELLIERAGALACTSETIDRLKTMPAFNLLTD
jgi:hypothetical protein